MDCFNKLVSNKFLANATNEFSSARKVLQKQSIDNAYTTSPYGYSSDKLFWSFDRDVKKQDFDYIADGLELDRYINTKVGIMMGNQICVLSTDEVLIVCAYKKKMMQDSINYCYLVNGFLPYYVTRKRIDIGRYVHVALIWKEVRYDPFALN